MFKILNHILLTCESELLLNYKYSNFEESNINCNFTECLENEEYNDLNFLKNENLLNNLLDEWIKTFSSKIKPFYEMHTYFRDPFNVKIIYLFVYNTIEKEIKYFEVNFLDIKESNDILHLMYHNISNNDAQFSRVLAENQNICSTFCSTEKRTYSFTTLFPMFFKYLCKDVKTCLNILYRKNGQFYKSHSEIMELKSFYQYFFFNLKFLKSYIEKCENIILSNDFKSCGFLKKYVVISKLDLLEIHISKWRTKVYRFNNFTRMKKLDFILKLSHDLNSYNLQKGITRIYIAKLAFKEILKIKDRLDRYSYLMIFLALYSKRNDRYNDTNICNLTSLVLTYNNLKYFNDKQKFDYTYLLFKICKKRFFVEELQKKNIKLFSAYKISLSEMKYVIINRYLFIIMNVDAANLINLHEFKKNKKEFELFCGLILLTIKTKCKIFGFEI